VVNYILKDPAMSIFNLTSVTAGYFEGLRTKHGN